MHKALSLALKADFQYLPLAQIIRVDQMEAEIPIPLLQKPLLMKPIDNDPEIWRKNKLEMYSIMKRAPVAGIYKHEDPKEYDNFFQFYLDFLNSETGPRGQCSKKVREEMKADHQIVDEALKPYKLSHKDHIRNIWVKFRYMIPCPEYHDHQICQQTITKVRQNLKRLNDESHAMYVSIKTGMLAKHGQDYSYKEQIGKLKTAYEQKLCFLEDQEAELMQKLDTKEEYHNFIRVQKVMNGYFDQWIEADRFMGKDSNNRGGIFENKVLANIVPYILKAERHKVFSHIKDDSLFTDEKILEMIEKSKMNARKMDRENRLHVLLNMKWVPRSLGQIDICVAEYDKQSDTFLALVMIECKARLFDVREASYQVFFEYFEANQKNELSGKYGPVRVSNKVTSYIITTLPDYEFQLPIQSKLRESIDRVTKDIQIEAQNIQKIKDEVEKGCRERLGQELSPLEWMIKNDSEKIIVLSENVLQ